MIFSAGIRSPINDLFITSLAIRQRNSGMAAPPPMQPAMYPQPGMYTPPPGMQPNGYYPPPPQAPGAGYYAYQPGMPPQGWLFLSSNDEIHLPFFMIKRKL